MPSSNKDAGYIHFDGGIIKERVPSLRQVYGKIQDKMVSKRIIKLLRSVMGVLAPLAEAGIDRHCVCLVLAVEREIDRREVRGERQEAKGREERGTRVRSSVIWAGSMTEIAPTNCKSNNGCTKHRNYAIRGLELV